MPIQAGQTYPNPAFTIARWAWETVPGVTPLTGWHDFRIDGEALKDTVAAIERTALNPSGRKIESLLGKVSGAIELKIDVISPLESWGFFCWMMQHSSVTSPESGAYIHKIDYLETAQNYPRTMCIKIWRDDGAAMVFNEVAVSEIVVNFAEKQLSGLQVKGVGRASYWADAVRTAGTGTDFPRLRGLSPLNFAPTLATARPWLQVTAFDSTTVTCKVKMSDGASFPSGTQVFQRGFWTQIQDETGLNVGSYGSPVDVIFLTGDVFAVGDTFRIDNTHPIWVPAYPAFAPVNEVEGAVFVDGAEIELSSGSVTMTAPAAEVHGYGRRQGRRTRTRGLYGNPGTFTREVTDRAFRARIENAKSFRVELWLRSSIQLGAANLVQGFKITRPLCKLLNASTAAVDSNTVYNETIPYESYPSTDGTYPADTTVEVYNTIPDLTAA